MQWAVFSDIHGNLEAFRAVLADLKKIRPDRIINLGDMVGYGPYPEEVVQLVRRNNIETTLGNHEHGLLDSQNKKWFNPSSREVLEMTRDLLSKESLEYFRTLPRFIAQSNLRFTHAMPPDNVHVYLFAASEKKIMNRLKRYSEHICFTGHTHMLELVTLQNKEILRSPFKSEKYQLDSKDRYIINVGSVGQPRGKDARAKYVLYNDSDRTLKIRYVHYNIDITANAIIKKGFPERYANRLYGE